MPAAALESARALLARHFGFASFRPLQERVIRAVLAGGDVLAVLPTGGGKSVCFQVPALHLGGFTLVLSPLISLMQDQTAAALARAIPAAALNSTLTPAAQRRLLDRIVSGDLRLLYTSPERLKRLVRELAEREVRPSLLAVDEAHCISEWGPDFRPAFRALRRVRAELGWPPVVALTGSATADVRADIVRTLGLGRPHGLTTVLGSFDRRNLWFGVARVGDEPARLRALLALLRSQGRLAIVYGPTRNLVEELTRVIGEAGFRTAAYHAGQSAVRRSEVLEAFLADRLQVVVATCAFGMGIDKPNVRLVVHWNMPPTPEGYYQEAGRAGRDGVLARCVLLYRRGDAAISRRQLAVTFPPEATAERAWADPAEASRLPGHVRESLERLRRELRPADGRVDWRPVRRRRRRAEERIATLERYAEDHRCRRAALLAYFGERIPRCAGCDVCGQASPQPLPNFAADRRLARLRLALGHARAPWGGCVLDPGTLRRLADRPPEGEEELAAVAGVGPVVAARFSRTILGALGPAAPTPGG